MNILRFEPGQIAWTGFAAGAILTLAIITALRANSNHLFLLLSGVTIGGLVVAEIALVTAGFLRNRAR